MEGNYLSWNFTNWVTVILMVAVGMAVIGTVTSFVRANLSSVP